MPLPCLKFRKSKVSVKPLRGLLGTVEGDQTPSPGNQKSGCCSALILAQRRVTLPPLSRGLNRCSRVSPGPGTDPDEERAAWSHDSPAREGFLPGLVWWGVLL